MWYEINVAKNGTHYFATAQRSLQDLTEARAMFEVLCDHFPASEGFELMLSRHSETAEHVKRRRADNDEDDD